MKAKLVKNSISSLITNLMVLLSLILFIFFFLRNVAILDYETEVIRNKVNTELNFNENDPMLSELNYKTISPEQVIYLWNKYGYPSIEKICSIRLSEELPTEVINGFNDQFPFYLLFTTLIISSLVLIRGWINLKKNIFGYFENDLNKVRYNKKKIKLFFGKETASYGIFNKKIILGLNFLTQDKQHQKFMFYHELAHLRHGDSIIKNFLMNFRKFLLPIILLYIILKAGVNSLFVQLLPLIGPTYNSFFNKNEYFYKENIIMVDDYEIRLFMGVIIVLIIVILILFFFRRSIQLIEVWYSKIKELISDEYASYKTGFKNFDFINQKSKFHPKNNIRSSYINQNKRQLDLYPLIFFYIVFLNLDILNNGIISRLYNFIFYLIFPSILFLYLFLDLFYFKISFLSLKGYLSSLFLMIIFSFCYFLTSFPFADWEPYFTIYLKLAFIGLLQNLIIFIITTLYATTVLFLKYLKK